VGRDRRRGVIGCAPLNSGARVRCGRCARRRFVRGRSLRWAARLDDLSGSAWTGVGLRGTGPSTGTVAWTLRTLSRVTRSAKVRRLGPHRSRRRRSAAFDERPRALVSGRWRSGGESSRGLGSSVGSLAARVFFFDVTCAVVLVGGAWRSGAGARDARVSQRDEARVLGGLLFGGACEGGVRPRGARPLSGARVIVSGARRCFVCERGEASAARRCRWMWWTRWGRRCVFGGVSVAWLNGATAAEPLRLGMRAARGWPFRRGAGGPEKRGEWEFRSWMLGFRRCGGLHIFVGWGTT
jgi:hypothetical protein